MLCLRKSSPTPSGTFLKCHRTLKIITVSVVQMDPNRHYLISMVVFVCRTLTSTLQNMQNPWIHVLWSQNLQIQNLWIPGETYGGGSIRFLAGQAQA